MQEPGGRCLARTWCCTAPCTTPGPPSASDLPGIDFITGNMAAAAGDAQAMAAFTEAVRQQAGNHD